MILPIPISIYDDVVNINKLKKRREKKQQNNTQMLHQKQMWTHKNIFEKSKFSVMKRECCNVM